MVVLILFKYRMWSSSFAGISAGISSMLTIFITCMAATMIYPVHTKEFFIVVEQCLYFVGYITMVEEVLQKKLNIFIRDLDPSHTSYKKKPVFELNYQYILMI